MLRPISPGQCNQSERICSSSGAGEFLEGEDDPDVLGDNINTDVHAPADDFLSEEEIERQTEESSDEE